MKMSTSVPIASLEPNEQSAKELRRYMLDHVFFSPCSSPPVVLALTEGGSNGQVPCGLQWYAKGKDGDQRPHIRDNDYDQYSPASLSHPLIGEDGEIQ